MINIWDAYALSIQIHATEKAVNKRDDARLERAFVYTGRRVLRAATTQHRLLWIRRRNTLAWLLIDRETSRLKP
jgi:hypothetical protein